MSYPRVKSSRVNAASGDRPALMRCYVNACVRVRQGLANVARRGARRRRVIVVLEESPGNQYTYIHTQTERRAGRQNNRRTYRQSHTPTHTEIAMGLGTILF